MTEKLRPCPYCGGCPAIYGITTEKGLVWKLKHGSSPDVQSLPIEFATREEAHAAWNRRVSS